MTVTSPPLTAPDHAALAGIGCFLFTIVCFAVMDTLIKFMTAGYPVWEVMFFRAVFALLPIAVLTARSGGVRSLRTARPLSHIARALVGVAAVYGFFYGLSRMPLADAYAISFAAPLFTTALSLPLLGERVGRHRWMAVLVGFVGVLIILQPGRGVISVPALAVLAGTFCYALTMLYVRHLSRTESNPAITFYFMITLAVVSGIAMLPDWRMPASGTDFALLAATGIVGGIAQIGLTQAFRLTTPSLLAPFEYSGLIWATLFGYVIFGDLPGPAIWIGGAVVIASGLYILHRETGRGRT